MHHVFEISEISRILTSVLDKRTLYALALTSNVFQEPALDSLWSALDSVVPLISLLGPLQLSSYSVSDCLTYHCWNTHSIRMLGTYSGSSPIP